MKQPKYLLCPGTVVSERDGANHYIGAPALLELYKVKAEDCLIAQPWMPPKFRAQFIELKPRQDGDYTTPTEAA